MRILKIGIDLLWVRPGKVGGTESYIRNLLKGFLKFSEKDVYFVLFVSLDNAHTFASFGTSDKFSLIKCGVQSRTIARRIFWENTHLDRLARNVGVDLMFIPVYSKPKSNGEIPYVVTIHDLQALHFPEYFSRLKRFWLKRSWKKTLRESSKIVAISDFVKQDITEKLHVDPAKIKVIHNPVVLAGMQADFRILAEKYGIESKQYLYTVSSMLPHKNLPVLIKVVAELKKNADDRFPCRLVISGIGGTQEKTLKEMMEKWAVSEDIILTGFISDEERDSLYKNAFAFLFPSTFEGFGMPPVEAIMCGTPVITTKCASIPEVVGNEAYYVDESYSVGSWLEKLEELFVADSTLSNLIAERFAIERICNEYLEFFTSEIKGAL